MNMYRVLEYNAIIVILVQIASSPKEVIENHHISWGVGNYDFTLVSKKLLLLANVA